MVKNETVPFRNKADGWWGLRKIIAERKPFKNSTDSFRGAVGPAWWIGRLPELWRKSATDESVDYTIYSYSTPIAWHNSETGEWVSPPIKYSVTTSGHQGIVWAALSQLNK